MNQAQEQAMDRLRCAHCKECIEQEAQQRLEHLIQTTSSIKIIKLLNRIWWRNYFAKKNEEA